MWSLGGQKRNLTKNQSIKIHQKSKIKKNKWRRMAFPDSSVSKPLEKLENGILFDGKSLFQMLGELIVAYSYEEDSKLQKIIKLPGKPDKAQVSKLSSA